MDAAASVFVGRDTRKSSPALATAVLDGVDAVQVVGVLLIKVIFHLVIRILKCHSGVHSQRLRHRIDSNDSLLRSVQKLGRRLRRVQREGVQ